MTGKGGIEAHLGGHESFSARCINQVVESNVSSATASDIVGSDGLGVVPWRLLVEKDLGDACLLEDGGTGLLRVSQEELVQVRPDLIIYDVKL